MARANYYNNRPSRVKRWMRWIASRWSVMAWIAAGVVVLALGWYWQSTLLCRAVAVTDSVHADPEEVRSLARVDTGQVLYDIDPAVIQDRVMRHPWIRDASVSRLPTGTLSISVEERTPRVLVVGGDQRPAYYLDYEGYQMPAAAGHLYNVPLIRGLQASYEPEEAVQDSTIRSFLRALETKPEVEKLISEIRLEASEVRVHTVSSPDGRSIPVRMGTGDFESKLTRLAAFWNQAVHRYDRQYRHIDLRFDDQVVVRETS